MAARFFINSRGNKQLIDPNNHVYVHNKTKENGKSFWRCANYKTCDVSVTLNADQTFVRIPDHDHGSDIAGLEAKLQALNAIEKARKNPNIRPRQILGELAALPGGPETKLAQRTEGGLTKAIQRARAKERNEPEPPKTFADMVSARFPEEYSKTSNGSNFLLVKDFIDENSDKAFCIFMSPFGKQLLTTSRLWLADGTFFTAPPPFAQVYLVCGQSVSGNVLPAAYCLLPSKETRTYDRMWTTIKFELSLDEDVSPDVLKMDYEAAAANAFRNSFPGARISGCLFHLKKISGTQLDPSTRLRPTTPFPSFSSSWI